MLFKLAIWYLKKYLKDLKSTTIVISEDFHYFKTRNIKEEISIKQTRDKIKL